MSSKNNVNPDHYKTGGRDRPGDDAAGTPPRASDRPRPRRKKGDGPPPNLIPGAPPVGERPTDDEDRAG